MDETGTTNRASRGEIRYSWSDYHHAQEGRGLFLLGLNEQTFHMVPHRALTPEQIADLRGKLVEAGLLRPAGGERR